MTKAQRLRALAIQAYWAASSPLEAKMAGVLLDLFAPDVADRAEGRASTEETEEEFEAFLAGVDAALTRHYGPDHQAVLTAGAGPVISAFLRHYVANTPSPTLPPSLAATHVIRSGDVG
jgi:hypothetical protein